MGRTLDAERVEVGVHRRGHLVGQRAQRDAALERAADDLVVDVGDVAHIADAVAAEPEPALHHIEGNHHPRVAHMTEVIDGDAAHIHADMAGF